MTNGTMKIKWSVGGDGSGYSFRTSPAIDDNGTLYVIGTKRFSSGFSDVLHAIVDAGDRGEVLRKAEEDEDKTEGWPFGMFQVRSLDPYRDLRIKPLGVPLIDFLGKTICLVVETIVMWVEGDPPSPRFSYKEYLYILNRDGVSEFPALLLTESDESGIVLARRGLDRVIYVRLQDHLLKVDLSTGKPIGEQSLDAIGRPYTTPPTIITTQDTSVHLGANNAVYRFDLQSANPDDWVKKWICDEIVGQVADSSLAIGDDGTVYAGTMGGHLHAIHSNGKLKWTFRIPEGINEITTSPVIGTDGTVYVGRGRLYAINPLDGLMKWKFPPAVPPLETISYTPVIGSDGYIYVGTSEGRLYKVDPQLGTEVEYIQFLNEAITSAPVIFANTLYVCAGGKLYAINCSAQGVAASSWPMYCHDRHHSSCTVKTNTQNWQAVYTRLFTQISQLNLLRRYRDEVLQQSENGKQYISLLYHHAEQALTVLIENVELQEQLRLILVANFDSCAKILTGQKGVLQKTEEILAFLANLAEKSPPELRQLSTTVRADLLTQHQQGQSFLGFETLTKNAIGPNRSIEV